MITWKEKNIHIFILASFYLVVNIFSDYLFNNLPWSFLIASGLLLIYCFFWKKLKDAKRVGDILADSFSAMSYTIISERPLTIKEYFENLELNLALISGTSVNNFRYKNKMQRYFVVRNEKDHDFELIVTIKQTWGDELRYYIDNTSRLR